MKKILLLLLSSVLAVYLSGCATTIPQGTYEGTIVSPMVENEEPSNKNYSISPERMDIIEELRDIYTQLDRNAGVYLEALESVGKYLAGEQEHEETLNELDELFSSGRAGRGNGGKRHTAV